MRSIVAVVVAWMLTGCTLIAPTNTPPADPSVRGVYGVGVLTRTLQRFSHGKVRQHETRVWYPARAPATESSGAVVDAAPDEGGAPYPILMWSHGLTSSPTRSTALIEHLVSHGFVVVAPQHISDCQPADLAARTGADERGLRCTSDVALLRLHEERPNDIIDILDAVLSDPALGRLVDRERVAVGGYSQGGGTALEVVARDKRFRAALALAPSIVNPTSGVRVPVLAMLGSLDSLVPVDTAKARLSVIPSTTPTWLLEFSRAGHAHFQNAGCTDQSLTRGTCADAMPAKDAQAVVARWSTAFLLRYAAGKTEYGPYLEATSVAPGVTVSSIPRAR